MKNKAYLAWSALLMAAVLAACRGCSSSSDPSAPPSPGADAGDGSVPSDSSPGRDSSSHDASDSSHSDAPLDTGEDGSDGIIPPGWEKWTGWSEACPLYIPGEHGAMPPPIQWEPCPAPMPTEWACRRMAYFWNQEGSGEAQAPRYWQDPVTKKVYLKFARWRVGGDKNIFYRLVAEADGPVRNAFLQTNGTGFDCQYFDGDMAEGMYTLRPLTKTGPERDGGPSLQEGVIGGAVDDRYPSKVLKLTAVDNLHSEWLVSGSLVLQWQAGVYARTWDLGEPVPVYRGADDPQPMPVVNVIAWKTDAFVELGAGGGYNGVMSWNAQSGTRPLLRFMTTLTKTAYAFGTDGTDMVWTYGEELVDGLVVPSSKLSVMTSPYTTDPQALQPRRVRSDFQGPNARTFVVGCGYAAREEQIPPENNRGILLVRLSDGVSWKLSSNLAQNFRLKDPVGITCEELFAKATFPDRPSVTFRVRLDSLGPGTAPD